MRNGDFAVEVVPASGGRVRETESGHVLARPGQVYRLRLRNLGPLYCVVTIDLDGRGVTGGGLVLEPWSTTELERPVDATEDGCFTVIAEGNEHVFGPDGGRDNASLGLIEARFRRELPGRDRRAEPPPVIGTPMTFPPARPLPDFPSPPRPDYPSPPSRFPAPTKINALMSRSRAETSPAEHHIVGESERAIERAAGTGLTGHSEQRFRPVHLGPLETEATVIQLRVVIGTEAALAENDATPLVESHVPSRPAARP
jgi:hypothetical protein